MGVIPSSRLKGMCCWIGPHFHDWIDYYGFNFLSTDQLTKKKDRILIKDLISNK